MSFDRWSGSWRFGSTFVSTSRPTRQTRGLRASRTRTALAVESLEGRTLPSRSSPVPDDFGDTFADARLVVLDASGSGSLSGEIEAEGDVDVFRFVAPATGLMDVRQDTSPGSQLESSLSAYELFHGS